MITSAFTKGFKIFWHHFFIIILMGIPFAIFDVSQVLVSPQKIIVMTDPMHRVVSGIVFIVAIFLPAFWEPRFKWELLKVSKAVSFLLKILSLLLQKNIIGPLSC